MKIYCQLIACIMLVTVIILLVIAAIEAHRWLISVLLGGILFCVVLSLISCVMYDDFMFWRHWYES